MKKVLGKVKKYRMLIVGIVVGLIIFGGGVYAATIGATNVSYSNASSGMYSNTVQGAVDELYGDVKEYKNFAEKTGTSYGITVFHEKVTSYFDSLADIPDSSGSLKQQVDTNMSNCMGSCMAGTTDGSEMSYCSNSCIESVMPPICGKTSSSFASSLNKISDGCNEKCFNNGVCYKACVYKAVGNTTCASYYIDH